MANDELVVSYAQRLKSEAMQNLFLTRVSLAVFSHYAEFLGDSKDVIDEMVKTSDSFIGKLGGFPLSTARSFGLVMEKRKEKTTGTLSSESMYEPATSAGGD
jgi:hypothetical protein